ncbi:MAG: hypothetical protein Fur005_09830 [Roseiflexaceae bacterium]
MTTSDLLEALKEGLANGRITPHLAAYIAAEVLGIEAEETDLDEVHDLEERKVISV